MAKKKKKRRKRKSGLKITKSEQRSWSFQVLMTVASLVLALSLDRLLSAVFPENQIIIHVGMIVLAIVVMGVAFLIKRK